MLLLIMNFIGRRHQRNGMRIKNQSAKSSGTSVGSIFRTAKNVFTSNAVQEKAKKFNYGGKIKDF